MGEDPLSVRSSALKTRLTIRLGCAGPTVLGVATKACHEGEAGFTPDPARLARRSLHIRSGNVTQVVYPHRAGAVDHAVVLKIGQSAYGS
jgi:hypothetical protein